VNQNFVLNIYFTAPLLYRLARPQHFPLPPHSSPCYCISSFFVDSIGHYSVNVLRAQFAAPCATTYVVRLVASVGHSWFISVANSFFQKPELCDKHSLNRIPIGNGFTKNPKNQTSITNISRSETNHFSCTTFSLDDRSALHDNTSI
jgi:hypothetical protein